MSTHAIEIVEKRIIFNNLEELIQLIPIGQRGIISLHIWPAGHVDKMSDKDILSVLKPLGTSVPSDAQVHVSFNSNRINGINIEFDQYCVRYQIDGGHYNWPKHWVALKRLAELFPDHGIGFEPQLDGYDPDSGFYRRKDGYEYVESDPG